MTIPQSPLLQADQVVEYAVQDHRDDWFQYSRHHMLKQVRRRRRGVDNRTMPFYHPPPITSWE